MSNIFFTSDTHFGHANILKYCNRPFGSIEEMDEQFILNWNDRVRPGDTVYHLGDFAFVKTVEQVSILLERLNGQVHLIYGNHDFKPSRQCNKFAWKGEAKYIRIGDQKITLYHYNQGTWRAQHKGAWCLFGHSHNSLSTAGKGKTMDVGVDVMADFFGERDPSLYAPMSFEFVKSVLDLQPIYCSDYHKDIIGKEIEDE